jgi:hypothetical protein
MPGVRRNTLGGEGMIRRLFTCSALRSPLFWIAAVVLLLVAFYLASLAVTRQIERSLSGPRHTFQLSSAPAFLTEELAAKKATEAMRLDGLGERWRMEPLRRTKAPDGTPDVYLYRYDPKSGIIDFYYDPYTDPGQRRIVSVELSGSQITCEVDRGK